MQRLIDISKGWYIISEEDGSLYFNDLRFGKLDITNRDSYFVFSYKLIPDNGTIRAEEVMKRPDEGAKLVRELWERLQGN